jgi:hypothetical protein
MVLIAGGRNASTYFASAEVYQPLTPPGLVSIAVTPADPAISPTSIQQFTATGTFSDGSTETLSSVTWSSSSTAVATITDDASNRGVAVPAAPGTTTITAVAGSVSGSTALTVRQAGFVFTGSMTDGRYLHTATLLNNGMVLITGGVHLASAELYNPATGTFSITGSMTTARYGHTATLLNNGMVLITGGQSSTGYSASAELYNPATGTFTGTAGPMTTGRSFHTATLLNNGMVLITGGYSGSSFLASAELYNPATGTFSITGSMTTGRSNHTATLLNNGMVLITGGFNLASAQLY